MKKKALQIAIGLFIISNGAFAQWGGSTTTTGDTYRDGNVGIGTNTPGAKLDVNMFDPNGGPQSGLLLRTNTFFTFPNAQSSYFLKTYDPGNTNATFIINGKGWLGIGTSTPQYPLDVNGDVRTTGSVGIGTTNVGSFKLAVEGNIGAREVQVTLTNPFPDYVFDSKYKLRNLSSLENYINENKHLPNVPSATEVEKNGGIELGEMNRKLLEKVEELSLYIIEINKKVERLGKENEAVKKRLMKNKN